MQNSRGPRILPCGTPDCMVPTAENLPFAQTFSDLSDRYDWKKGTTAEERERERERERETDRQTDRQRQTDRERERERERERYRQTDRQTDRHTDRHGTR